MIMKLPAALKKKETILIFRDILQHKVHTPEEIANELNLPTSSVDSSLNELIEADLIIPVLCTPAASGSMTFYSASLEGLILNRAIKRGYGLESD